MTDRLALPIDLSGLASDGPLPVERWNPPFCGDIDMRIDRDGRWHYNGSPIQRPDMVRLFSRILKREGDAYFLVTPAEKVGIMVADVPFIAVELEVSDGTLRLRTNVGDLVTVDGDHPLSFDLSDGFTPYAEVRGGLKARLSRDLARDLAALGDIHDDAFGVWSAGQFFAACPASEVPGL